MKTNTKLNYKKGSVLIWVMVALLVISMLTVLVLTISSRYFTSTKERSLDSQAYHSAYSLTRSIASWLESYDPILAESTPVTDAVKAEKEKKAFLEALVAANEPIIVDASNGETGAGTEDLSESMGVCKAVITYTKVSDDLATISILSTATFEGRENSVEAILESSFTRTNVSKNVRFDGDFDPDDFKLNVNVVGEINNAVSSWPDLAKNPAYVGRASTAWRYFTVTKESFDITNPSKPTYFSLNPRVAGGNSTGTTNARPNKMLYYSNPQVDDTLPDKSYRDFLRNDGGVPLHELQSKYINQVDMRVYLDPEASMLDNSLVSSGAFKFLPGTTSMPKSGFFGNQSSLTNWPTAWGGGVNVANTATLLQVTGVAGNQEVPGTRFTYFTNPDFDNPALDSNYILGRYLSSGTSFAGNDTITSPWSQYKELYLYLLNESDKYFQITGAVSTAGGAIYTKRDFIIGGSFLDSGISSTWDHLGKYPTQLNDMQMYFASPADTSKTLDSVIQATPPVSTAPKGVPSSNPTTKTRIDGGWIVVQNNHKLTIRDALINTQKFDVSAKIAPADFNLNTSSARVQSKGYGNKGDYFTTLNLQVGTPANDVITGKKSGNDIYVTRGGHLVLDKGALICSDIYLDEGSTLTFPAGSNAVLYGNIYSKGTINIESGDVKIYGKPEVDVNYLAEGGSTDGIHAGGIFNYDEGTMTTTVSATNLVNLFPNNNVPGKEKLMGIHSYVEFNDTNNQALKDFVIDHDQTDLAGRGICTHFDIVSGGKSWRVVSFDDY